MYDFNYMTFWKMQNYRHNKKIRGNLNVKFLCLFFLKGIILIKKTRRARQVMIRDWKK